MGLSIDEKMHDVAGAAKSFPLRLRRKIAMTVAPKLMQANANREKPYGETTRGRRWVLKVLALWAELTRPQPKAPRKRTRGKKKLRNERCSCGGRYRTVSKRGRLVTVRCRQCGCPRRFNVA